jgi:hypothetical protein
LKLIGAITSGSGDVNEDGMGILGPNDNIAAAWVFDGVTGINDKNYLPGASDAAWLVGRAHHHLLSLAGSEAQLNEILNDLVAALIADWNAVSDTFVLPEDYDPPAACIILAKRYASDWNVLRLGDSLMLAQLRNGSMRMFEQSPNTEFDNWLSREAQRRRDQGQFDVGALLAEFRPQLLASRKTRNTAASFGILKADPTSTHNAEYLSLGDPANILLCTDGFYRAVDHYALYDDSSLLASCNSQGGISSILRQLRAVEKSDRNCERFIRFKPEDDATAVMLHD